MADISAKITRKSLKAKQKAAIKTLKAQTQDKIKQIKIDCAQDPESEEGKSLSKEQKRTAREQRRNALLTYAEKMPREYTVGEDIFNSISHGIGAGLSVAAIVLLVLHAMRSEDSVFVFANIMFGSSLFIMYIFSTLYHALTPYGARNVFSIFTHDSIYILIAGTATPFMLTALSGSARWVLFIILWAAVVALVAVYSSLGKKIRSFSMGAYVIMGWTLVILLALTPIAQGFSLKCRVLLLLGGVSYTIGCLFFLMPKYKWAHSIFHIFVLVGSFLHFLSVWNIQIRYFA